MHTGEIKRPARTNSRCADLEYNGFVTCKQGCHRLPSATTTQHSAHRKRHLHARKPVDADNVVAILQDLLFVGGPTGLDACKKCTCGVRGSEKCHTFLFGPGHKRESKCERGMAMQGHLAPLRAESAFERVAAVTLR